MPLYSGVALCQVCRGGPAVDDGGCGGVAAMWRGAAAGEPAVPRQRQPHQRRACTVRGLRRDVPG